MRVLAPGLQILWWRKLKGERAMQLEQTKEASREPRRAQRADPEVVKNESEPVKMPDSQNDTRASSITYWKNHPLKWRHLDDDITSPR